MHIVTEKMTKDLVLQSTGGAHVTYLVIVIEVCQIFGLSNQYLREFSTFRVKVHLGRGKNSLYQPRLRLGRRCVT